MLNVFLKNFYSDGRTFWNMKGKISEYEKRYQLCYIASPDFEKLLDCVGFFILEDVNLLTFGFLQFITGRWNTMIVNKDHMNHRKNFLRRK